MITYGLFRAKALPQSSPTFGVRGAPGLRSAPVGPKRTSPGRSGPRFFLSALRVHVGVRPKYSHPPASKLAWAQYFWRCNHFYFTERNKLLQLLLRRIVIKERKHCISCVYVLHRFYMRLFFYIFYSSIPFLFSQPRNRPPSKKEMMIKKASAKRMKMNDGISIRVYFFPEQAPFRIKEPMRMR